MELKSSLTDGQPRATVLLAHGFGEHPGRYARFIEYLNLQQIDVWTFTFAGHGNEGGRRATANVGKLIRQHLLARKALDAHKRTPQVILFGHSMGGLVTLASTILDPTHLQKTVVTGPALTPLPRIPLWVARLGQRFGTWITGLKSVKLDDSLLSHDQKVIDDYRQDPLVYHGRVPLLTGSSMVVQGRRVIENAGSLTVPTLILHGTEDGLASLEGSEEFASSAPEGLVELRPVEGAYHEVLNEPGNAAIASQITNWIW